MKTIALVLAAGKSRRMQNRTIPKQYLPLGNSTILREVILSLKNNPEIDNVLCVINKNDVELYRESVYDIDILSPVFGGKYRNESIYNGLMALEEFRPENVIIHDASRPFLDKELLKGVVRNLEYCDAVIPAIKEEGIFKSSKSGNIIEDSVNTEAAWKIQTPEGYRFETILELYKEHEGEYFNGPASLFEVAGLPVNIIPGSKKNFSIRNVDDYEIARSIHLSRMCDSLDEIRVGNSFEICNFKPKTKKGAKVTLFGMGIPMNRETFFDTEYLGLNAIADSILGALGEGCVYRSCLTYDSEKKTRKPLNIKDLLRLLDKRNATINNIDTTVVCNAVDLSPYVGPMKVKLSILFNIPENKVNIKSSYTEDLNAFKEGSGGIFLSIVCCLRVRHC